MAFTVRLFLLSSLLLLPTYVLAQTNGSIAVGASLSTAGNSSWLSPSGDFAFGFRQLENNGLFLLSIWFAKIPDKTIVWYAYGDKPAPNGSVVNLTANSGLVLTSPQGEQLWKSNQTIAGVVAHGVMIDTGNFVLENEKSALSRTPNGQFSLLSPFHFSLPSPGTTISGNQFTTPPPPINSGPNSDQNPRRSLSSTTANLFTGPSKSQRRCSLALIEFQPFPQHTSAISVLRGS